MAPLFCHLHQLTSLLMKRIFSHQHRRGWQSMPPPATEAMRTRLRAEYRQRKVIPLCRCFISPPHPNLYQLTSPPTKRIVLLSTGLRVCFNVPCPAALADTARRERIIMATGERRSRQKKTFFKKLRPLTSLFFKRIALLGTGWRVCFNVPRPEAFWTRPGATGS